MASNELTPRDDALPVLVIAGPTASGKSGLALAAAEAFDGVVINADSMQVYRRLRILTARPSRADERRAPHRLYGWLEPDDICSAGRWQAAALDEIAKAHASGKLPIVVGGTGFYIEALTKGMVEAPAIPAAIRETARFEVAQDAAGAHAALAAVDPSTAARISPTDPQRLARALEVWRTTGAPPSRTLEQKPTPPEGLRFHSVVLAPPRETLYRRIDRRAEEMAAVGALAEAASFRALGLPASLPASKAVGLREFAAAAHGEILLHDAIEATATASRRYAKRQMTWIRGRAAQDFVVESHFHYDIRGEFIRKFQAWALTG